MQIKIDAQDMLYVLVDAGIDATDAKAIIFDLLQLPDNGPERDNLLKARRARLEAKSKKATELEESVSDDEESYVEDDEDDEDDVVIEPPPKKKSARKAQDPLKPTKLKKPKRVSFSTFGGTAPPLR